MSAPSAWGCVGMSEFDGATDGPESLATVARTLEFDLTFLDTADTTSPSEYWPAHPNQTSG